MVIIFHAKVFISTMVMTGDRNHNFSGEDVPASETFLTMQNKKACWELAAKQDIPKEKPISSQPQQVQCGISSVENSSVSQDIIAHSVDIGSDRPGEMATSHVNRGGGVDGTQENVNSKSKEGNGDFLHSSKCDEKPLILKEDRNTSLVSVVDRIKRALHRVSQMYEESKLKNGKGSVPDLKTVEKPNISCLTTTPYLSVPQDMPDKPQPIVCEGNTQGNESLDSTVRRDSGGGEIESSLDICMSSAETKANKQIAIERNTSKDSETFETNPQVLDSELSVHSEKTDHEDNAILDENGKEADCNIKHSQVVDSRDVASSYSTPTDTTLDVSGREESSIEEGFYEGIYDNIFEKVKLDSDIVREEEAMEIAASLFLQNTQQDGQDDTMSRSSCDGNAEDDSERNEDIEEFDNIDFAMSTVCTKEIGEEEGAQEAPSKQTAAQRLIEKFKLNIDNNHSETDSVLKWQKGMKSLPAERAPIIGRGRSTKKVSNIDTKSQKETKEIGGIAKGGTSLGNSSNYLRLPPQLMKKSGKSTRINRHKVKEAVKRYREQLKSRKHEISNAETSDSISSARKGKAESVQSLSSVKEPRNINMSVKTAKGVGNSSDVKNCTLEKKSGGTEVAIHKTSHKEHQSLSKTGAAPVQIKCLSAVKKPMIVDRSGIRARNMENSSNVNNYALETESAKAEVTRHKTSHKAHQSLSKTSTVKGDIECLSDAKGPRNTNFSAIKSTDVGNSSNVKNGILGVESGGTVTRHKAFQKEHQSLSEASTVPRQVECFSAIRKAGNMNTSSVQVENEGISSRVKNCALGTRSAGTDNTKYKASHKGHQGLTKTSTVWKQATTYKVCVKIICTEKASYVKQTKKGPVNVCDKSIQITTVKTRVNPEDRKKYEAILEASSVSAKNGRPTKEKENENKVPLTIRHKNISQLQKPVRVQEKSTIYSDKREGEDNGKTKAFSISSSDDDDEIEIIDSPVVRKCITSSSSLRTKSVSSMTDCNKAVVASSRTVVTKSTAATVMKQLLSSSVVNTNSCSVSTGSSTMSRRSNCSSISIPIHVDRNTVLANRVAPAVSSSVQSDKDLVRLPQAASIAKSKIAANATNSTDSQNKSNAFPKIVGICSLAKPNGKIDDTATLSRQTGAVNVSKQNNLKIDIAENPAAKSILETLLKGKYMLSKSSQFSAGSSASHSNVDMSIKRAESSQSTSCCIGSLNSAITSNTGSFDARGPLSTRHKPYAVNSTTLPGNIFSSLASLYSQKTAALSSTSTSIVASQQAESMSVPQMNVPQQHQNFYHTGTYCIPQADIVSKPLETYSPKQLVPTASLPKPGYQPAHQAIDRSMAQGVLVRIMKDGEGKYVLVPVPNTSSLLSPVVLPANSTNPDVAINTAHYLAYQHVRNPIPQSWKNRNVALSTAQSYSSQHVRESILQSCNDSKVALNTAQGYVSQRIRDSIPQSDKNLNIVLTTAQNCTTQPVTSSISERQNRPYVALTTAQDRNIQPVPSSISQSCSKLNIALTTAQSHTSQPVTNPVAHSQNSPDVALTIAETTTSQSVPNTIPQRQNNANVALTTAQKLTSQPVKNLIPRSRNSLHAATTTDQDHTLQPFSRSVPQGHYQPNISLTTAHDHTLQFVTNSTPQSQNNTNVAVTTTQDHASQSVPNSIPQGQNKSTVALMTDKDHASPLVLGFIPRNQSNPDVGLTSAQSHAPQPLPNSTPKSQNAPDIALANKQSHGLQPLQSQNNVDAAVTTSQDHILKPVSCSIPQTQKDPIVVLTTSQDHATQSATDSISKSSNNPIVALTIPRDYSSQPAENLIPQSQNNSAISLSITQSRVSQPLPNSTQQGCNNSYIALTNAQNHTLQSVPNYIPKSQKNTNLPLTPGVPCETGQNENCQTLPSLIPQSQKNSSVALTNAHGHTLQLVPYSIPYSPSNANVVEDTLKPVPSSIAKPHSKPSIALTTAQSHTSQPLPNSTPQSQNNVLVAVTTAEDHSLRPLQMSIPQDHRKSNVALTTSQGYTSQPITDSAPRSWGIPDLALKTAQNCTSQTLPNPISKNKIVIKRTIPTLTYNHQFASQAPNWAVPYSSSSQNKAWLPAQTAETSVSAPTEKPMLPRAQVPISVSNMPQIVAVESVSGTKGATSGSQASLKVNSEDVQSKTVTNNSSSRAVVLDTINRQARDQARNHLPMKLDSKVANSASMPVGVSSNKTLQTQLESTVRAYKEFVDSVRTGRRASGNVAALSTKEQHLLDSHENASSMESNSQAMPAEKAINLKGDYDTSPFWLIKASKKKVSDDLRYELQSSVFKNMRKHFSADMKGVCRQPKDCDPSVVKQITEKPLSLNSKNFEIKFGVFENQFALINSNRPKHSFSPDCSDQQFIQNIGLESVVEAVKAFEGAQEVVDDSERNQWMFVQCKEALERRMGKSIKRKLKEAMMRTSAIIERKVAKLEDSMKKVDSVSGEKQVLCDNEVEIDISTYTDKNEKQMNIDSKLLEKEKKESRDPADVVPDIDIEYYANGKEKISTQINARAKSVHKISFPKPVINPFKRKFDSLKSDDETKFDRKGSSSMNRKTLNRKRAMPIKVNKEAGGGVKKMKSVNGFKVRELFVGVEDVLL